MEKKMSTEIYLIPNADWDADFECKSICVL